MSSCCTLGCTMLLLSALPASALPTQQLQLPTFVSSHMALQRQPHHARLWGWTAPGRTVTVTLDNNYSSPVRGVANASGSWQVDLPPQPAGAGHTIAISDGNASSTRTLVDVAFGDIYLCSGQSNMEFSVNGAFNASSEIADSINYPNLRLATVRKAVADSPIVHAKSKANYSWARSGPAAMVGAAGPQFSYFSATCYFFGREVYKALGGKVPIGLVASDWGGQRVECFSSADALADTTCGGTRPAGSLEHIAAAAAEEEEEEEDDDEEDEEDEDQVEVSKGPEPNPGPSQLWNAMIFPLLPMRFAGAVWYQGESNAGGPISYACRFPAMIADWRAKFDLPDLSFFYVSLAAYHDNRFAELRSAQDAALQLPRVGRALAIDIGDPSSPEGSIHPRRKQEVGRRLALAARAIQYAERGGLVYDGPVVSSVRLTATGATLGFEVGTADGLHLVGTAACTVCCGQSPFEVLLSNGMWARANASVDAKLREVHLTSAASPFLGIRLEWEGYPQCSLSNGRGGPDGHKSLAAGPFEWCAYPTGEGAWTGAACSPTNPNSIYYPASHVPSIAAVDYRLWGAAGTGRARTDARCTKINWRSGNPGTVGYIGISHSIVLTSAHALDSVSLAFRYVAGYTPTAGQHKKASTVSVQLVDGHGQLLRTLFTSPSLGNYSYDVFRGFSPPINVSATGLNLRMDGAVAIALMVVNNERNLQIPLDDKAGGWNVALGWV